MLLQPASDLQSAVKAALFGGGGSGKTLTSILIAIGLSKTLHGSAPIAFVDPEGVQEFIKPVCEIEGVPLLVLPSRTFVDMRDALAEAEGVACAFVVDHYDGIFRELTEAQKVKLNLVGRKLPYAHREELQRIWDSWVRQFRASPVHCIFNGRLAWDYGDDTDENGDTSFVKLGTKMRGESDAGYEPNLLIEMERIDNFASRDKKTRSKKGQILHAARVLKDRRMILNGLTFTWKDLNAYKAGDYKTVYGAIHPHCAGVSVDGGRTAGEGDARGVRSSGELFQSPAGESAFAERARRIAIAAEDFQSTLQILWPGTTQLSKACHAAAIEAIFQVRSWSAVESKSAEAVEAGALTLRACEAALPREADGVAPTTRAEVLAWILAIQSERLSEAVL